MTSEIPSVLPLMALPVRAADPPGPPWPDSVSLGAITLRWYPDEVSEAEANRVANAHCAATGRSAVFAALERDGSAELGTYRCRWVLPLPLN